MLPCLGQGAWTDRSSTTDSCWQSQYTPLGQKKTRRHEEVTRDKDWYQGCGSFHLQKEILLNTKLTEKTEIVKRVKTNF